MLLRLFLCPEVDSVSCAMLYKYVSKKILHIYVLLVVGSVHVYVPGLMVSRCRYRKCRSGSKRGWRGFPAIG